eukprot:UN01989
MRQGGGSELSYELQHMYLATTPNSCVPLCVLGDRRRADLAPVAEQRGGAPCDSSTGRRGFVTVGSADPVLGPPALSRNAWPQRIHGRDLGRRPVHAQPGCVLHIVYHDRTWLHLTFFTKTATYNWPGPLLPRSHSFTLCWSATASCKARTIASIMRTHD